MLLNSLLLVTLCNIQYFINSMEHVDYTVLVETVYGLLYVKEVIL